MDRKHMTATIGVLVFDLGGVLIDWNPRYLFRAFFPDDPVGMERFLHEIRFPDWNAELDAGRPFMETLAELQDRFPQYDGLLTAFHQRWEETLGGPIPSTVALLPPLKRAGYSLHALSNWSADTFSIARRKYPFLDLFDSILISGDVKIVKPDPRIYQIFLARFNRKAEECLFIDDNKVNTDTARDLGFQVVWLERPEWLQAELRVRKLLD
jgi:2-haloacid dehalogenase